MSVLIPAEPGLHFVEKTKDSIVVCKVLAWREQGSDIVPVVSVIACMSNGKGEPREWVYVMPDVRGTVYPCDEDTDALTVSDGLSFCWYFTAASNHSQIAAEVNSILKQNCLDSTYSLM